MDGRLLRPYRQTWRWELRGDAVFMPRAGGRTLGVVVAAATVVPLLAAAHPEAVPYSGHRILGLLGADLETATALVYHPSDERRVELASDGPSAVLGWSADGDAVSIAGGEDGRTASFDPDTGQLIAIGDRARAFPSPDGRWVALADDRGLRVRDERSGETTALTDSAGVPFGDVVWTADGSAFYVLLHPWLADGLTRLWGFDVATEQLVPVTPDDGNWRIGAFAVLPDGRHVVVRANSRTSSNDALHLVRSDGSAHRPVLRSDSLAVPAAWLRTGDTVLALSPDGGAVLEFLYDRDPWRLHGLYSIDLQTSITTKLVDLSARASRALSHPTWSPDGARVAITVVEDDPDCRCEVPVLYEADLVGPGPPRSLDLGPWPRRAIYSPGVHVRLAGHSRTETAVRVSSRAFASADTVVVARHDLYPDALAGAPLARRVGAPLLLSPSTDLHVEVAAEIRRLGATRAVLLGSEAALSSAVGDALRAMGLEVVRHGGLDRFDTARLIAMEVASQHVYVVKGVDDDASQGWPDAAAVAGLAARQGRPILLVRTDEVPEATRSALLSLGATHATIVGGPSAVSRGVEEHLVELGLTVDRIAGADRYETSYEVAEATLADGATTSTVWVATGQNWPDALSVGPAAAATDAVLLLIPAAPRAGGFDGARAWFSTHGHEVVRVHVAGGADVLTARQTAQIERLVAEGR